MNDDDDENNSMSQFTLNKYIAYLSPRTNLGKGPVKQQQQQQKPFITYY